MSWSKKNIPTFIMLKDKFKKTEWYGLSSYLWDTGLSPWGRTCFVMYFIFFILGFSAIGPWSELFNNKDVMGYNTLKSFCVFSLTLSAATMADVIMGDLRDKQDRVSAKTIRFVYLCAFLSIMGLSFYYLLTKNNGFVAYAAVALTLAVWWTVNACDDKFNKQKSNEKNSQGNEDEIQPTGVEGKFNL